jgi:hypothetical protein
LRSSNNNNNNSDEINRKSEVKDGRLK